MTVIMATMNNQSNVYERSNDRGHIGLTILNWGVFAFVTVSGLSWWAVCLMVIPYPKLIAQAGASFGVVFTFTGVFTGLSLVSGIALWLVSRRHALQWYGQAILALIIISTAIWALQFI